MNVPLIPHGTGQTGWSWIMMILNIKKKKFTKNSEVPADWRKTSFIKRKEFF